MRRYVLRNGCSAAVEIRQWPESNVLQIQQIASGLPLASPAVGTGSGNGQKGSRDSVSVDFHKQNGNASVIVEYTRYKIDPEHRNAFADAYQKAAEPLQASEHCLAYELTQCIEGPDHHILRIEWTSEQGHLQGFRNSPEFISFLELVRPYVKNIVEMRHYRIVGEGRKRSR
jgi:quinol monooxygenase YgiN